ncbi:MAG: hypothetical protein ACJA0H_002476 [Francisellaceae bacterium]|jgi:hypothetical protein
MNHNHYLLVLLLLPILSILICNIAQADIFTIPMQSYTYTETFVERFVRSYQQERSELVVDSYSKRFFRNRLPDSKTTKKYIIESNFINTSKTFQI